MSCLSQTSQFTQRFCLQWAPPSSSHGQKQHREGVIGHEGHTKIPESVSVFMEDSFSSHPCQAQIMSMDKPECSASQQIPLPIDCWVLGGSTRMYKLIFSLICSVVPLALHNK